MNGSISRAENTARQNQQLAAAQAKSSKLEAKSTASRAQDPSPAATLQVDSQTRTKRAATAPRSAFVQPQASRTTTNDIKTLMSKFSTGPQIEKIAIIMQNFIMQSRKVSRNIMYAENELYMSRMEAAAQSVRQQAVWAVTGAALAGMSIAAAGLNFAGTFKSAKVDKGGLKSIENKITGFTKKNIKDIDSDSGSEAASRRGSIADPDTGSHRTLVDGETGARARADSDMLAIVDDDAAITFPARGRPRSASDSAAGSHRTLVDSDAPASPRNLAQSTDDLRSVGDGGTPLTRTRSMGDLRSAGQEAAAYPTTGMRKAASQYDLRAEHSPFESNALGRAARRGSEQPRTGTAAPDAASIRQSTASLDETIIPAQPGTTAAALAKAGGKTKLSKSQRLSKLAELEEELTPDQQKDVQNLRGLLINTSMRTMTRYQAGAGLTDATGKMASDTVHSLGTFEKVEQIAEETASSASQFARGAAEQMTGSLIDSIHKVQQRVTSIIESESDTRKYSIRA